MRKQLGIRTFEIGVRHDPWPAVSRAGDKDGIQVMFPDQPVHVQVDEIQARSCTPMAQQPWLDMLDAQRPAQQRIVAQINLPDRQIIGRAPVAVHICEHLGTEFLEFLLGKSLHGRLLTH